MKLAECLIERSELQKKIQTIEANISKQALIQDGDKPLENIEEQFNILTKYYHSLGQLSFIINRINNTTQFASNEDRYKGWYLCDALAYRTFLDRQITQYTRLFDSFNVRSNMYSKSEIKFITTMNPIKIKSAIENLQELRKNLDRQIQVQNWGIDVPNM